MATLEETLDKAIEVAVKRAILKAHPVGSLYLSLTDENPSISLGGVHGTRLARGNACGERTVAMQWEQKLVQGCRTSQEHSTETEAMGLSQCRMTRPVHSLQIQQMSGEASPRPKSKVATCCLMPLCPMQSTVHQRRFNRPLWRSTFGRGQRNGYV